MNEITTPNPFYSKISGFFDLIQWITGYKLAVYYFIDLLPFNKEDEIKVLDAGCGTGLFTFALLNKFPKAQIEAFDLNSEMLDIMKAAIRRKKLKNKINTFTGNVVEPLPLQNE